MARTGSYKYVEPYSSSVYDRVRLPDKVKCVRCKKFKGHNCFSNNRLGDLKAKIYGTPSFDASIAAFIACNTCTPTQVYELHCIGCDKTKAKSAFSKVQCRNPDKAKCWPCMEEQRNMEPGAKDSDEDSSSNSATDSDSDYDAYGDGASTIHGTMSGLSLTNGSSGGGVALNSSTAPSTTSTTTSSRAVSVTNSTSTQRSSYATPTYGLPAGFDPNAYRGTRCAPSSIADSGSGGGKFAKVKAVREVFSREDQSLVLMPNEQLPQKTYYQSAADQRAKDAAEDGDDEPTVSSDDSDSD